MTKANKGSNSDAAEVEVLNDDVQLDNETVTAATVVKATASDPVSSAEHKSEVIGELVEEATKALEQAKKDLKDSKEALTNKAQKLATDAKESVEEVAKHSEKAAETFKDAAQDKLDNAKDAAANLAENLKDDVKDAADTLQDRAAKLKDDSTKALDDIKDSAREVLVDAKKAAEEKLTDAKTATTDFKDKAAEVKDGVSGTVADIKELASEKLGNAKALAGELFDALKDKVQEAKNLADEKISDAKITISDKKNALNDTLEQAKDTLLEKKDALLDEGEQLQEQLQEHLQEQKDTILETKEEVLDKLDEAAANAKAYEQKHADKHGVVMSKLGMLGAYMATLYAGEGKTSYSAVDLNKTRFDDTVFKRQSSQIGKELFGSKAATASKFANKFIANDKMNALSEAIYGKLADWASSWATADLAKDERFDRVHTLSDSERNTFATDVSNQNRALATLGGVSGFMGLKGVVLDTAWLLMVALKSVYQLSMVYDKPLTGKEGATLAYGILSECNLDKLQEKQVLMTALALGGNVLKNSQNTSIVDELKKIGSQYQNQSYGAGLDKLSEYINLDRFNPSWLHYALPIGSSVLSAHYSNALIEEVLGTAQATFAGSVVKGLLENKSLKRQQPESSDEAEA